MDSDLVLVIGVVAVFLAIPSLIAAFSESRPPRMAITLFLVGGAMILIAAAMRPSGYRPDEVPGAFVRVIGRIVN
ncbi:hypothetical protein [Ostreiculturibacter nitratireducens]|uniref:hypothetical protein n=1 Tax=Ostreiculturibacter nitratireducens TaxID=3075226 RepID=UPI0031B63FDF